MAKPHKFAWNGLDAETSLSVESVANMAQRAAHESTGNVLQGKQRIVSVRSSDREIEFRINDYLISFNKLMVFLVALDRRGDRTYVSTTIDWYMTSQTTVSAIPVSNKKMVAHHTYMQFASNLSQQIRAADPTARITLREGVRGARPSVAAVTVDGGAESAPLPPPPPAAPSFAPPPPPPPRAAAFVPPVPPPPPMQTAPPTFVPPSPPASVFTPPPSSAFMPPPPPSAPSVFTPPRSGVAPQAAALFAEDEDLGATRAMLRMRGGRPWVVTFADGRALELSTPLVFGRDPLAPESAPSAVAVPVIDPRKSLSKTHALLEVRDAMLWVTDLHSTNGTSVTNAVGEATVCPPGVAMPVGEGWAVSFGEVSLVARLAS